MTNNSDVVVDRPSRRMMNTWSKRLRTGKATPVPIYIGGSWSMMVVRGNKRVMQLNIGALGSSAGGASKPLSELRK
ncbi:MAG: hypothetical protein HYZ75_13430 [Elusimicrobia bacterium]|nr:hypothetical protein [Elusimicrobiota bacterium]